MRTIAVACALVCLAASASALAQEPPAAPPPPTTPTTTAFGGIEFVPAPAPAPVQDAALKPTAEPRSVNVDLGVATEFPISAGAYLGLELPGRLLLQVGAGVMPGPYANAIDGVLVGVGAYDTTVSAFIKSSLSNSFVLRASAGWRPFTDHGFEMMGGYTLITLGGAAAEGDIVNAVLAEAGSSQRVAAGSGASVPLAATMHNFHVTLGWRWLLADDHLVVRASVSYLQCVASSFSVKMPDGSTGTAMEATINNDVNAYLNPYMTRYGKTPLAGLSAAYRF